MATTCSVIAAASCRGARRAHTSPRCSDGCRRAERGGPDLPSRAPLRGRGPPRVPDAGQGFPLPRGSSALDRAVEPLPSVTLDDPSAGRAVNPRLSSRRWTVSRRRPGRWAASVRTSPVQAPAARIGRSRRGYSRSAGSIPQAAVRSVTDVGDQCGQAEAEAAHDQVPLASVGQLAAVEGAGGRADHGVPFRRQRVEVRSVVRAGRGWRAVGRRLRCAGRRVAGEARNRIASVMAVPRKTQARSSRRAETVRQSSSRLMIRSASLRRRSWSRAGWGAPCIGSPRGLSADQGTFGICSCLIGLLIFFMAFLR